MEELNIKERFFDVGLDIEIFFWFGVFVDSMFWEIEWFLVDRR